MTTPFRQSAAREIVSLLRQRETREVEDRSVDRSPSSIRHLLLPEPSDSLRDYSREVEGEPSQEIDTRESTDGYPRTREKEKDSREAREMETEREHLAVVIDEETPLVAPLISGDATGLGTGSDGGYGRVGGARGAARLGGMQEIFMDRGGKARDGLSGPDVMSGKSAGMSENGGMRNEEEPEDEDQPQCRICLETDGRDLIAPCRCKGSARFVHRHCLDQWRATKEGFAFCHCSTCKARFQLRVCLPPDLRCRHLKFRFFVARDIVLITLLVQMLIICFGYTAYVADYYWFDMGFQKTWDRQSPAAFYYICGVLLFLVSAGLLGAVMTCVDRRFRSDLAAPCRDLGACCCNPLVCGSCDCHVAPICLYSDCSGCSFCFSGCSDCAAAIGGCTGEAGLLILLTLGAILLVVLALVGVFYCLLVSTLVVQRIWQRHYHVLAKRILTKEFIVEDLSGMSLPPEWSPPPLLPEHEKQLRDLRLL